MPDQTFSFSLCYLRIFFLCLFAHETWHNFSFVRCSFFPPFRFNASIIHILSIVWTDKKSCHPRTHEFFTRHKNCCLCDVVCPMYTKYTYNYAIAVCSFVSHWLTPPPPFSPVSVSFLQIPFALWAICFFNRQFQSLANVFLGHRVVYFRVRLHTQFRSLHTSLSLTRTHTNTHLHPLCQHSIYSSSYICIVYTHLFV